MAPDPVKLKIQSLINSDTSNVSYVSLEMCKLPFKKVFINNEYSNYVKCTECPNTYIVKYTTGTWGMKSHVKSQHRTNKAGKSIQKPLEFFTKAKLNAGETKELERAAAFAAAADLLPLTFTEKRGLKHYIDVVAKICHSKKGLLTSEELCPSHNTNMKYVNLLKNEAKEDMKMEMDETEAIHTTCDHWKEDKTNRNFFTVTSHFIPPDSSDVTIKSTVIATIETSCKTAKQIKEDYQSVIKSFGIESKVKSIITDSASANKSAFTDRADIKWYSCSAHNLNLVLLHAFTFKRRKDKARDKVKENKGGNQDEDESDKDRDKEGEEADDDDYEKVSDIANLIKSCKELVTYSKQSGLNALLDTTLKQSVETRWDSTLNTLESINQSYDQLLSLAKTIPRLNEKLLNVNRQIIDQVVALLKPFRTARQKLCRNSVPTFHEVAVIKQFLYVDHLREKHSDLSVIKCMKERLRKWMEYKFVVTTDHLVASFLTPGLKTNFLKQYHDQNLVADSRKHLKSLYSDVNIDSETEPADELPAKKPRNEDILSTYYTTSKVALKYQASEIERYQIRIVSDEDRDQCPIAFWSREDITISFPKLSIIAKQLLSIPATSVKSEQNFSAAGQLLSDRRTNLKSDNVDAILLVRSNDPYFA